MAEPQLKEEPFELDLTMDLKGNSFTPTTEEPFELDPNMDLKGNTFPEEAQVRQQDTPLQVSVESELNPKISIEDRAFFVAKHAARNALFIPRTSINIAQKIGQDILNISGFLGDQLLGTRTKPPQIPTLPEVLKTIDAPEAIQEIADTSSVDEVVSEIGAIVVEGLGGASLLKGGLKALAAGQPISKLASATATGVSFTAADAIQFIGGDPNISALLKEHPDLFSAIQGPLLDFLATDPEKSPEANLLGAAVESAAIGIVAGGVELFIRAAIRARGALISSQHPKMPEGLFADTLPEQETPSLMARMQQVAKDATDPEMLLSQAVDRLYGIKKIDKLVIGKEGVKLSNVLKNPEVTPYESARLLAAVGDNVNQVLDVGMIKLNADQSISFTGGPSLKEVFEELGDNKSINEVLRYMFAKRVRNLRDTRSIEVVKDSDELINEAIRLGDADPVFKRVLEKHAQYNDELLQFAVDSGLIDIAFKKKLLDANPVFIPIYRLLEDGDLLSPEGFIKQATGLVGRSRRPSGRSVLTRALEGSPDLRVADLSENLVRNTSAIIEASMKQQAKRNLFDQLDVLRQTDPELADTFAVKILPSDRLENLRINKKNIQDSLNILMAKSHGSKAKTGSQAVQFLKENKKGNINLEELDDEFVQVMTFNKFPRVDKFKNVELVFKTIKDPKTEEIKTVLEFYDIKDKLLWDAIQGMSPQNIQFNNVILNGIFKTAKAFKNLTTFVVTRDPSFAFVKNPVRDGVNAGIVSESGQIPVASQLRGVRLVAQGLFGRVKRDSVWEQFRANGGALGTLYTGDVDTSARQLQSFYSRNFPDLAQKIITSPRALSQTFGKAVSIFEYATRVAEFERLVKLGVNPRKAAFASREISTDFAMHGANTAIRVMTQISPFLNPTIQGTFRTARAFKENTIRTFAKGGLYVVLPSLFIYSLNRKNPDYQNLNDFVKDSTWPIPVGTKQVQDSQGRTSTVTDWALVPKPFDFGMAGSLVERFLESVEEQNGEAFTDAILRLSMGQLLDTGQLIPQAVKLVLPFDPFTGKAVVPERLKAAGIKRSEQFEPYTSQSIISLAQTMSEELGIEVSPLWVEKEIIRTTGIMGELVLGQLDNMVRANNQDLPSKPTPRLDQLPVFRSLMSLGPAKSIQAQRDISDPDKFFQRAGNSGRFLKLMLDRYGDLDIAKDKLGPQLLELASVAPVAINQLNKISNITKEIRRLTRDTQLSADDKAVLIEKLNLTRQKQVLEFFAVMRAQTPAQQEKSRLFSGFLEIEREHDPFAILSGGKEGVTTRMLDELSKQLDDLDLFPSNTSPTPAPPPPQDPEFDLDPTFDLRGNRF